jgi:hypothetical protein
MNAGLTDRTTTGNLVLQQTQTEPQAQDFFHFSHGHFLLGHEISSTLQWRLLPPRDVQRCLLRLTTLQKTIPGYE